MMPAVFSTGARSGKTKRHGFFAVPRSLPSRLGRLAAAMARSARSSSATGCFSAFSSGDARLFTGEFVRRSLLVCCASTFRRDRALRLRVHRRKSARCLANVARATRFCSAVVAPAHSTASTATSDSSASAPLVHPLILVVPLVCHYRSPAAIFELNDAAAGRAPRERWAGRSETVVCRIFYAQALGRNFGGRVIIRPSAALWISSLLTCL